MNEGDQLDTFNFWPAFADLMLSVILILLLIIGGTYYSSINVRAVHEEQKQIGEALLTRGRTKLTVQNGVEILGGNGQMLYTLIEDANDPMLLTISFSNSLLFMAGDFHLKPEGEDALLDVGQVLRTRLVDLAEIQIRGHADTTPFHTQVIEDNLELASLRSNEVYRFLTKRAQINPAETLISATSFGEFSPVQRSRSGTFDEETLDKANESESLRQANRRIELVLFFRKASGQPKTAPAGSAKRFVPLATGK